MPRPDPLPRFNRNRKSRTYHALDSKEQELEDLRAKLRQAERSAAIAIRERDLLKQQLLRAGMKPKKPGSGKRKPPEAGIAVPAEPPKGPLPKQGGAEAPLEFD